VEGAAEFHQQTVNFRNLHRAACKGYKVQKSQQKFLSTTIIESMLRFTGIY